MVSQAVKYIGYASPFAIVWLLIVVDVVHICDHCKFHFLAAPVYVILALAVGRGGWRSCLFKAHAGVFVSVCRVWCSHVQRLLIVRR
jgi:hypothetical protein